jgi:hypothetical protein
LSHDLVLRLFAFRSGRHRCSLTPITEIRFLPPQQIRQLGDIGRDPPR